MSSNYQNAVYVPTGLEPGEFITISGYCYKRVESNVRLVNINPRADIIDGFLDCEDCNSCRCPKNIEFLVGGISRNISNGQSFFEDIPIQIQTSSTGWQEIALESGFLNKNDPDITFEPLLIRCYDRKIDENEGIYVKFKNQTDANLGHFTYNQKDDYYIRDNAFLNAVQGLYGEVPDWDYINIYDRKVVANEIDTIKFKSNCDIDCSKTDISFRIHGKIKENQKYLLETGNQFNSFIYADCYDIPQTFGEVVDCIPNYTGLDITNYFIGNFSGSVSGISKPNNYKIEFSPTNIELVNKDLLLGLDGSDQSKAFSVTGSYHFHTFSGTIPQEHKFGHENYVYLRDNQGADVSYSSGIGRKYKLDYNKPPFCFDENVYNKDFNSYYRYNKKFTNLSGCFQASEYADGIYKNGTYTQYFWSGTVNGNQQQYVNFVDSTTPLSFAPSQWESGGYVYQWYVSGDRSDPSAIKSFNAFFNSQNNNQELHKHYQSMMYNSGPINTSNSLYDWEIKSGNFPIIDSKKVYFSIGISGDNNNYSIVAPFNNSGTLRADPFSDLYDFQAPVISNTHQVVEPMRTFPSEIKSDKIYALTDSGNIANSIDNFNRTINKEDVYISKINSLKFQLRWDKGAPIIKKQKNNLSINMDYSEYTDNALSDTDKIEIKRAVSFFEKAIISDRTINLKVVNYDELPKVAGGVLAYAGPLQIQEYKSGWFMPTVSRIAIDPLDLNYLRQPFAGETNLYWITVHEVSHALGLGTFWNYNPVGANYKLIELDQNNGAQYLGMHALREYARYIGNFAKAVPIQTKYSLEQPNNSYSNRSITISQTRTITGTEAVNGFILIEDPWGPTNLQKNITASALEQITYNVFLTWGGHLGETAPDLNPSVGGYTAGTRTYKNLLQPLIRKEISTPFYDESDGIEISKITLAFLEDLGYTIDYSVI